MLKKKTFLRETKNKGIGIFADEYIKLGEVIHFDEEFFDKEFSKEFVDLHRLNEFFDKYAGFNSKKNTYYLCLDNARFMNHSESPNTFYDIDKRHTVAIKEIKIGDEITTNYMEFDDLSKEGELGFKVYEN